MLYRAEYRTHLLLLSLLIAGVLVLWLRPLPASSTLCLFKTATGIDCPSCGTGHGINELLAGNFLEAWKYNPLSYVVSIGALFLSVIIGSDLLLGRKYLQTFLMKIQAQLQISKPLTWLMIIVVLLNWYSTITIH